MKGMTIAVAVAFGALVGWTVRGSQCCESIGCTEDIIVQHPQQNSYGIGSGKTRIRLYGVGDDDFAPMPENTSNATLWIVTINGTNYRGVAQEQ